MKWGAYGLNARSVFAAAGIAIALGACSHSTSAKQPSPASPAATSTTGTALKPCLDPSFDTSHPTPATLTAAQWREYRAVYRNDAVIALRHDLDAFNEHRADPETTKNLTSLPMRELTRRFYVNARDDHLFGGQQLGIQFVGEPEAAYDVWMYHLSNGTWVVRGIGIRHCTPAESKWITTTFGATQAQGPSE